MRSVGRFLARVALLTALTAANAQQTSSPSQPTDAADKTPRGVFHVEGPAGGPGVALSEFDRLPPTPGAPKVEWASLKVQAPLAVYTLGPVSSRGQPPPPASREQQAADASLEKATPLGTFMYPIVDGNGKPLANVTVGMRNGNLGMRSANTVGPIVDALAPAVARVQGVDLLRSGSFELRYLQLPPIGGSLGIAQVLWLASDTGSGDFIYVLPVRSVPPHIHSGALYAADDFFELLKPALQRSQLYPDIAPVWR
jgi:hypothetical protein